MAKEQELKQREEEDIALAIAISQSEAEEKVNKYIFQVFLIDFVLGTSKTSKYLSQLQWYYESTQCKVTNEQWCFPECLRSVNFEQ